MKKFLKRSLLVMIVILSMIVAFSIAVSAEAPAGTVASATVDGQTKYYSDFSQLVYEANGSGNNANRWSKFEIELYADVKLDIALVAVDSITVKAADGLATTPTLTVEIANLYNGKNAYRGGFVFASPSNKVEFKDINVVVKKATIGADITPVSPASLVVYNSLTEATVWAQHTDIVFDNVNVTSEEDIINMYSGGEFANAVVTVNGGSFKSTGSFINAEKSSTADKFAFNVTITGDASFEVTKFYNTPVAGVDNYACFADDASANAAGFGYRIGDTATGNIGVVYFATEAEALIKAPSGVKVWNVTGATPVEVQKKCEHTFVDTVVDPTCDQDGYTEHKCSKCGEGTTDTPVAALGHKYSKATCTSKAKCSVCNKETGEFGRHKYSAATCTKKATCEYCAAERGELAKHVDANADNKCDKCEAKLSADATTAAAAEEKKGCKGTVSVAGLALVAALGSCALFVEKKRK